MDGSKLKANFSSMETVVNGSRFGSKVAFDSNAPKLFVSSSGDFENIPGNVQVRIFYVAL